MLPQNAGLAYCFARGMIGYLCMIRKSMPSGSTRWVETGFPKKIMQ